MSESNVITFVPYFQELLPIAEGITGAGVENGWLYFTKSNGARIQVCQLDGEHIAMLDDDPRSIKDYLDAVIAAFNGASIDIDSISGKTIKEYVNEKDEEIKEYVNNRIPAVPVSSVNGMTGSVAVHGENTKISAGSESVTIKAYIDGKTNIGGQSVKDYIDAMDEETKQYVDSRVPTIPVLTVNGITGDVVVHGMNAKIDGGSGSSTIKEYIDGKTSVDGQSVKDYVDGNFIKTINNEHADSNGNISVTGAVLPIDAGAEKSIKEYVDDSIHGIDSGVISVNGESGMVVLDGTEISIDGNPGAANVKTYIDSKDGTSINIDSSSGKTIKQYVIDSINNIPQAPVQSVNGQTGNVIINIPTIPVNSVNSKTGAVVLTGSDINITGSIAKNIKTYVDETVSAVNGNNTPITQGNQKTIKAYIDELDTGVTSVNGQTGTVSLYASNLAVSSTDSTTIKAYIDGFQPKYATEADIRALFASGEEGD